MPTYSPDNDAFEFAARLNEALADCGINVRRGAGAWLARKFKISGYSGNAWINGTHKPNPDRAQDLADLLSVQFEWLYFGRGSKHAAPKHGVEEASAPLTMSLTADELTLLRHYRAAEEPIRKAVDVVLQIRTKPLARK